MTTVQAQDKKRKGKVEIETVEDLITILKQYPKDMLVASSQNEPFCYISSDEESLILSDSLPIAICNRTGTDVFPTYVEGYYGFCPELHEDLVLFEVTPVKPEEEADSPSLS